MEETRSALTRKLETLENRVLGTVETAQQKVEETVDRVKSTFHETVDGVKRAFDVRYQARQRPWTVFGCSVVAGYLLGNLDARRVRQIGHWAQSLSSGDGRARYGAMSSGTASYTRSARPGVMDTLRERFGDEIEQLKAAAVGALIGAARDWLKESMPGLAPQIDRIACQTTEKLGGEPVSGPVFGHQV
jgi:ElaB/YqjD/DUF883 family membrane-anchored ribosome-binding protein